MNRVLLVDDSIDCQLLVSRALQDSAQVNIAADLGTAKKLIEENDYELVLLDVGLPDGDGFGFCSMLLAEKGARRPRVVFLTGCKDISDRLMGFSVGADDYVSKPFHPLELKARVQAHLRGQKEAIKAANHIQLGNLILDMNTYTVDIEGLRETIRLDLTPSEFKLLGLLARNDGRILTRDQLLATRSEENLESSDRTIDSHICRIRKKLAATESTHNIEAVYGVGYRMIRSSEQKKES